MLFKHFVEELSIFRPFRPIKKRTPMRAFAFLLAKLAGESGSARDSNQLQVGILGNQLISGQRLA